jgi:hypothetical protein
MFDTAAIATSAHCQAYLNKDAACSALIAKQRKEGCVSDIMAA